MSRLSGLKSSSKKKTGLTCLLDAGPRNSQVFVAR